MRRIEPLVAVFLLTLVVACGDAYVGPPPDAIPPTAAVVPHELERHGDVRIDNYYWLNQRDDPDVRAYLNAENDYTEVMTAHTASLQQTLADEFTERIKQDDETVPYSKGGYFD